jgi:hypothetical protein
MFPYNSPRDTYEEYQERVARATQRHQLMMHAHRAAAPRVGLWNWFGARLNIMRRWLDRQLQPAEEGYIA